MSNTWIICPLDRDSTWKHVIIPDKILLSQEGSRKAPKGARGDESAAH